METTHPLGVHLADVGKSLRQDIGGHLISILVSELGGLALGSLRKSSGIGDGSGDDAADGGRDLEDVGDGRRVDELVLRVCLARVCQAVLLSKPTGTFFWERTTAQSFPRTPTDMMFAAVIALKAYSVQSC